MASIQRVQYQWCLKWDLQGCPDIKGSLKSNCVEIFHTSFVLRGQCSHLFLNDIMLEAEAWQYYLLLSAFISVYPVLIWINGSLYDGCKTRSLREDFNKKNCIFYDIVIKGRGVKDQNLISRNIWNLDKASRGVGERIQCSNFISQKFVFNRCQRRLFCIKMSLYLWI